MLRQIHTRPGLFAGIAVGLVVGLLIPGSPALRSIIGWDCAVIVLLAFVIVTAARATPDSTRTGAEIVGFTRWLFLALMAAAAFFSMFAILALMPGAKAAGGVVTAMITLLAGITILLSWLLAHTVFAVHYAHEYLRDRAENRPPGLAFPAGSSDPDYWDFLYFSFVIGMSCSVSDVEVLSPPWRRVVMAHGMLAFLFNAVVLGLSINLLAGFF